MDLVIKPPRFGANAVSGIGVGAFILVGGVAGIVLSLMVDGSRAASLGVAALLVIIGVGLVMPLTLIGGGGTLRITDAEVRIEYRRLMSCPWVIAPRQVRYVRYAPPQPAGWSLGFAPRHDSIEIRFVEPSPRAPIRYRFAIWALVSSLRGAVFMPIPGVRAYAVSVPADLTPQDRQFIDRLDYSTR